MKKTLSVLLSVIMVLSTISYALPSAVTLQDAVNNFISEAYAEDTAELAEDTWTDAEKGIKLFVIDFDTDNNGEAVTSDDLTGITNSRLDQDSSAGILISSVGRINPSLSETEVSDYRTSIKDTSSHSLGTENGDNYLSIKSTSNKPCIYVGGFKDNEGEYSFEIKYKYKANGSSMTHSRVDFVTVSPADASAADFYSEDGISTGDWATLSYTYNTGWTAPDSSVNYTTNYQRIVFYAQSGTATNFTDVEEICITEISYFYKPDGWTAPEEDGGETDSEWTHGTYGTKLFSLGFDKDNEGNAVTDDDLTGLNNSRLDQDSSAGILISSVGRVNPTLAESEVSDYRTSVKDVSSFYLGTAGDDSYLVLKSTSSKPCIYVGGFYDKDGEYTLEITYKFLDNGSGMVHSRVDFVTISPSESAAERPLAGDFDSSKGISTGNFATLAYTYDSSWTNLSDAIYNVDYQRIVFYGTINGSGANLTNTEEICITEIAMYYKAPSTTATVTLSANGNADVTDVAVRDVSKTSGIAVSELISKINTSSTTKTLVGLSKTADGDVLSGTFVPTEDTTLYMIWEDETAAEWKHETYGSKLFVIDFETKNDGTAITSSDYSAITNSRLDNAPTTAGVLISSVGRLNPSLPAGFADNYRVNIKDSSAVSVTAVDGDNALCVTPTKGGNNLSLFVGGVFDREGAYTIEINYKYADGSSGVAMNYINVRPQNIDISGFLSSGNWVNFPYDYEYTSGTSDYFRHIFYTKSGATGTEGIYLDDIAVYYQEPEENAVKVTLSANGNTDVSDVTVSNVSSVNGVAVSTLISKISTSSTTRTLLGISKTPAGALLSGTFIPTEDTTLYMIWKNEITEETGRILEEYSVEFEYDESSGNDVYWSNKGYVQSSEALTIPSTYSRNAEGHGVFTFKGANSESGVWDSNILVGTVSAQNAIPAGLVKGIAVKMRYRNIPTFTCSCKTDANTHKFQYYKSSAYNDATYSNSSHNMQLFYAIPDASYSGSRSIIKNFSLLNSPYNGEWFTLYFDVSSVAEFQENTVTGVRLDFSNGMWHDMVIDIDYIRFIGEPSKAPEQVEVDAIKTTKPVGYRFMASLSNELVSQASSYGWIIAREVSLENASISMSAFTYEAATENSVAVLRGTNFGEGRATALNFDADEENVYFTAMLYNIPSNMYEDVLVARPFAVIGEETYYGKASSKSIYDVAIAIRDGGFAGCTAAQQTYIQRVIDTVENA